MKNCTYFFWVNPSVHQLLGDETTQRYDLIRCHRFPQQPWLRNGGRISAMSISVMNDNDMLYSPPACDEAEERRPDMRHQRYDDACVVTFKTLYDMASQPSHRSQIGKRPNRTNESIDRENVIAQFCEAIEQLVGARDAHGYVEFLMRRACEIKGKSTKAAPAPIGKHQRPPNCGRGSAINACHSGTFVYRK